MCRSVKSTVALRNAGHDFGWPMASEDSLLVEEQPILLLSGPAGEGDLLLARAAPALEVEGSDNSEAMLCSLMSS